MIYIYQADQNFEDERVKEFVICALKHDLPCLKQSKIGAEEINRAGKDGRRPLYWYLKNDQVDDGQRANVVKSFIEHGADPFLPNKGIPATPYYFALSNDRIDVLKAFRDSGVDFNQKISDGLDAYPIYEAMLYGNARTIEFLIESGVDIEKRNHRGETPLLDSSVNYETTIYLINNGANVKAIDDYNTGICQTLWAVFVLKNREEKISKELDRLLREQGVTCETDGKYLIQTMNVDGKTLILRWQYAGEDPNPRSQFRVPIPIETITPEKGAT